MMNSGRPSRAVWPVALTMAPPWWDGGSSRDLGFQGFRGLGL